jgi:hypothetical protein
MSELPKVKAFDGDGLRAVNDVVDHLNTGLRDADIAVDAGILFSKLRYFSAHDIAVSATEKAVPHGLGRVPVHVIPTALSNINVWRSKRSDKTHVYLTASGTGTADVLVLA